MVSMKDAGCVSGTRVLERALTGWAKAVLVGAIALAPFAASAQTLRFDQKYIETVKKAEDSDDLIVRLYECHNSRGRAELSCARPIRSTG